MGEMTRVQIDLPKQRVAALDQLAEEAGGLSRKELFNNAISLMNWAVAQVRSGREIVAVDDKEKRMMELHMPFLDALKQRV